ncbi:MAG: TAXI family TRAP transporter solute-binding subunit [Ignavibacteriae bacterium]|nr:TAXI family TRAP transporter solute-binding subunit [Ignavibacteriota bacterium]MCB9205915.1 TAXI family TRAP transporter solute-binding subunit [Ignavibacteriales bacterium]MCB9210756.1 TAXI family TRAP transporter solute-binding subunit [Ignavibacteriales bacterium]MCB9260099.1 TAXI family TRAP transporter solute-binding subunit [Ignavibacteriales bacterium]
MKKTSLILSLLVSIALVVPANMFAQVYKFSGGPSGGTFQYYASAISTIAKKNKVKVLASASGGSIENIRTVNSGKSSFGVVYSGNTFDAHNGLLKDDTKKYSDVMAVAYFYGAPGQMIVKAKSGIKTLKQLEGKRVGVGNAGSGAAANAELMLRYLGLWDKITPEFLGYRGAADAFKNGQLDAFWVFAGYPNAAVLEVALQEDVNLLNIFNELDEAGYFQKYPYFQKIVIPAKTYSGQDTPVNSFQDAAIWAANKDVPADVVYDLLKAVYSDEGLKYMVEVHKSAKSMTVEDGLKGIVTPLHPGAEKFWKEKGIVK